MRKTIYALLLAALLLLPIAHTSEAYQLGACPPYAVQQTTPDAIFPANTIVCTTYPPSLLVTTLYDSDNDYPCDSYLGLDFYSDGSGLPDGDTEYNTASTFIVPHADNDLTGVYKIRLLLIDLRSYTFRTPPTYGDEFKIKFKYHDRFGFVSPERVVNINTYPSVVSDSGGTLVSNLHRVYIVEEVFAYTPAGGNTGGFLEINLQSIGVEPRGFFDIGLASIQFAPNTAFFPEHCPVPDAPLPATPVPSLTPTVTGTPPPTATPADTPTPAPTGPYYTPMPTITPTPLVFNTVASFPTPTPYGTPVLPTLVFPTFAPLATAAGGSVEFEEGVTVDTGGSGGSVDLEIIEFGIETIATRFAGINSLESDVITTTMGFTTTENAGNLLLNGGISATPDPILGSGIVTTVGSVVSYVRAVPNYLPSLSPAIFALMIAFGLVVFTVLMSAIVRIIFVTLEIIRRIIELIPFIG